MHADPSARVPDAIEIIGAREHNLKGIDVRIPLGRLTVSKADGADLLGSGSPLVSALLSAGFHMTPKGLRIRG